MRIVTVLSYNLPTGESNGVVETLVDVNSVQVIDQSGERYLILRGLGHKHSDQHSEFCDNLREQFGIELASTCQKTKFGYGAVGEAKLRSKNRTTMPVLKPVLVESPQAAFELRKSLRFEDEVEA